MNVYNLEKKNRHVTGFGAASSKPGALDNLMFVDRYLFKYKY